MNRHILLSTLLGASLIFVSTAADASIAGVMNHTMTTSPKRALRISFVGMSVEEPSFKWCV